MSGVPSRPVLVGLGMVEQREEDPARAVEALELMQRAVRAAGDDAGPGLLERVGLIAMTKGQWHYGDPGRTIAKTIGAPEATTLVALVGILQQTVIGETCRRIADGDIDAALVIGGEARYRKLRGRILGADAPESEDEGEPDELLSFEGTLVLESEFTGGLGGMPVGYYAIIESALRAAEGLSIDAHRDRVAALYSRFSEIAVDNPHAWRREALDTAFIRDASDKNPMLAFPYTKLHNSSWNVDQATALLLCSADLADEFGVEQSKRVYPLASAESNHALALSERAQLHRVPGIRVAGERAFDAAGLAGGDIDEVELYSCFPIAAQTHARELGVRDDVDWTVTGGMPFAGGPFNSYVLQSTGRMVERLRGHSPAGRPATGVVTSVSGLLTKHAVALWSSAAGTEPFACLDVTDEVAAEATALPVDGEATGPATVVGCTVIYGDAARHGVALVEFADRVRRIARTDDPTAIDAIETRECVGRAVDVDAQQFRFTD